MQRKLKNNLVHIKMTQIVRLFKLLAVVSHRRHRNLNAQKNISRIICDAKIPLTVGGLGLNFWRILAAKISREKYVACFPD